MRRFTAMSTTVHAATAAGTNLCATRTHGHSHDDAKHEHDHSHSHSHSGGSHGHSHGAIEANIKGRNLFDCKMATAVGGATNVFFGVTKLYVGSSGGSVALMADGFHSVTDIAADIVSYFSIAFSDKTLPRCRYPFGIGRLETSGAVIVAAILFFGGIALLIQSFAACVRDVGVFLASRGGSLALVSSTLTAAAYRFGAPHNLSLNSATHNDLHDHDHGHDHNHEVHDVTPALSDEAAHTAAAHGHSHDAHGHSHFTLTEVDSVTGQQVILWSMVALAASSVVIKELLYRWTKRVGLRAGSRVVVANAYHHRADAWSGGVALLGVLGACVGVPGIDGLAGCIVSLSICKIGYSLFKGSVLEFFDSQNVEELSGVRAQLQAFHVSVSGSTIAMETNASGAAVPSCGGCRDTPSVPIASPANLHNATVDTQRIRFVNVFLMRHGHSYVLYVTFLAHEDVTAAQLEKATSVLTALARKSLPVEMTYTTVQICQDATTPKAAYVRVGKETKREDAEEEADHEAAACSAAESVPCAATGDVVNVSLEKIIHEHQLFHGSSAPLTYNWEARELSVSSTHCDDCRSDAESIANMFHLSVVSSA